MADESTDFPRNRSKQEILEDALADARRERDELRAERDALLHRPWVGQSVNQVLGLLDAVFKGIVR